MRQHASCLVLILVDVSHLAHLERCVPYCTMQSAAFYVDESLAEAGAGGVATSIQHWGKEMSYNNYLDADAAYSAACDFKVGRAYHAGCCFMCCLQLALEQLVVKSCRA